MRTQKNATKNTETITTAITTTPPTMPDQKQPQSFSITLTAPTAKLVLLAIRKTDGSAITTATTTDLGTKKSQRGCTERHTNFEQAKGAVRKQAAAAEKLGWQHRPAGHTFVATPDAFSTLPAAPVAEKGRK